MDRVRLDAQMPPSFGALLKRHRLAAGLTQEELAERAGLTAQAITAIERGVRRRPYRDTVRMLAEALELAGANRAGFEAAARHPAPAPHAPSPIQPGSEAIPPLVGRMSELAMLTRHCRGDGPPVLLLAGEPGIGKSRLLQEARACALDLGLRVLAGSCQRRDGLEPFAPLLQALEGHLAQRQPAQQRTELQGCAWLVRLLPELAAGPVEPLSAWTLPPAQERRLMFGAVARFLANVAGPAGTLLLLDDLHWAGIDALDLLATLVRSPGGTPLRVIGAYRDTEVQAESPLPLLLADLAHAGLVDQLTLGPLASQEVLRLLDDLLEDLDGVAGELREQVLQRAGGVPFFVVSYARDLHANRRGGSAATPVPWSLAQSIRQRVAVLPETARTVLSAAALVGRAIPRTLLGAVLARPEGDLVDALEAACQARLLTEEEHSYQFAHDVIREVIEADLSLARRTVLHRRIGEVLERSPGERPVEALAYHFARGEAPEAAATYLEQAGDRAAARCAQAAAEGYYRALVASLDGMQRAGAAAAAREKLGTVLRTVARYDEALEVLEQAAETYRAAGDLESLGRVLAHIGHLHACRGTTLEDGAARMQPLLGPLAARGPSRSLAALFFALALLRHVQGQPRESLAAATRAGEVARAVGDAGLLAAAELGRGTALATMAGDLEPLPVLEEASLLAEAAGTLDTQGWALVRAARVHADRGEFDQCGRRAAQALTIAERLGDPILVQTATLECGAVAFFSGSWIEAREYVERLEALPDRTKFDAAPLLDLGRLSLAEGEWEQAARYLEECSALARRVGLRIQELLAERLLAERDLLEHRPEAALARLLPLLDRGDMEEHAVTTQVLPVLAWSYLERGEMEQATRTIEDALRRARAGNHRLHLVDALRVQAQLAMHGAGWPAAERALVEGLALARAMSYPHGEGRLLHVYGQMHAAKGESAQARGKLEAALAIFRRLGARKDSERTERLLAMVA